MRLNLLNSVCFLFILVGLMSCDSQRKKKCEWYLMPNVDKIGKTDEGFIPVCARNMVSMKEDCRLQTTLDFAKKIYGKKFKYVDLKVKTFGMPRTIKELKLCE